MRHAQHVLYAIGMITAVELSVWIVARTSEAAWREWHRVAGVHWLAAAGMLGSLGTVIFVTWLLILTARS